MRTRFFLSGVFFFSALAASWGQPKVAVLDALVQKGIPASVIVPVTEKLMERLVVSGKYTVLDRSNVEQVLLEREFQVSGLVSDSEVTEAGKFLGADFVVVVKVQKVDTTFFLSAKMIDVETGVISSQSSAEGVGKLAVVIRLAEEAGDVLTGVKAQGRAEGKIGKADSVAPRSKPERIVRPASAPGGVGTRIYVGLGAGSQDLEDDTVYVSCEPYGIDIYGLFGIGNNFCAVGNLTYLDSSSDSGPVLVDICLGIGYAYPMGIFMPWIAIKGGYSFIDWFEMYGVFGSNAFEFALDAGMDLRFGKFLLGARCQLSRAVYSKMIIYDLTATNSLFWLVAGYRF